jgi:DNA-directed RNA polymerase subunit RPC12/RpoP
VIGKVFGFVENVIQTRQGENPFDGGSLRMGVGITVECPNCSIKLNFVLGVGMGYSSLESVLQFAQPDHKQEIQRVLETHPVLETKYSHCLFLCENCNHLSNGFYVKLIFDSGQFYETLFHCSKCSTKLSQLHTLLELNDILCIGCGQKSLHVTEEYFWE